MLSRQDVIADNRMKRETAEPPTPPEVTVIQVPEEKKQ
jgi:hypothetical protein